MREVEPGPWQRIISRRCPKMREHHNSTLINVPCPDCYSIESYSRPIPYEPDSVTQVEPGTVLEAS